MPVSPEAERQVLGVLLLKNAVMQNIGFLEPSHFSDPANALIFSAAREAIRRGDAATPVTLKRHFEMSGMLQEVGGQVYLAGLLHHAPEAAHVVATLARQIRSHYLLREIIRDCREAVAQVDSSDKLPEEIAGNLIRRMERIVATNLAEKTQNNFEVCEEIIKDLQTQRDVTPTGLHKLDEAMGGGLYAGRSYGFAARKKVGKTVLASTISYNLNLRNIKHLFICGEMGPKEIHQRNLARELDVLPFSFRGDHGKTAGFQQRIADAAVKGNRAIIYQNAPGLTFAELRRYAVTAIAKHKIQGIILDYWQLVGGKESKKSTSEHLDEVAQWIADFGRQNNLWTITMAQINQEGNTRGGEGIRMAFDQVYQIHRDDVSKPSTWFEMMDTRYTAWMNIGNKVTPGFIMNPKGPYFEERL